MAEEERLSGALAPCGHDQKAMGVHERRRWLRLCAQLLFILPVPLHVHGRHRPAVHHPAPTWPQASVPEALKRNPLLALYPLPRPGPRPLAIPLGEPEQRRQAAWLPGCSSPSLALAV